MAQGSFLSLGDFAKFCSESAVLMPQSNKAPRAILCPPSPWYMKGVSLTHLISGRSEGINASSPHAHNTKTACSASHFPHPAGSHHQHCLSLHPALPASYLVSANLVFTQKLKFIFLPPTSELFTPLHESTPCSPVVLTIKPFDLACEVPCDLSPTPLQFYFLLFALTLTPPEAQNYLCRHM